jgi:hypothetical protein
MANENDQGSQPKSGGLNRRQFIAAVGATATSAAFLSQFAKADDGTIMYQDSFGNIVPASPVAIAMGVYPPPIPDSPDSPQDYRRPRRRLGLDSGPPNLTAPTAPQSVLMIMVDQLRAPRWLPFTSTGSGGQSLIDTLLPNIAYLRKTSFSFTNYFVCATACTPSRATLLTGLYSQQNCMFQTQLTAACQPSLQTGFENIASVLGGAGYDCYWVGKWHLSDPAADEAGPTQYEFISAGSFPPGSNYPSPNGLGNEGTEGANPDGVPLNTQPEPPSSHRPAPLNTTVTAVEYYNDAAIATYFNDITMPLIVDAINAGTPWFAAVSFVNPHDMSGFPYNFDLAPTTGVFGTPVIPPNICYPPPNTAGSSGSYSNTGLYPLPNVYNSTYSPPSSWNVNDNVNNTTTGGALVKPGLQLAFQEYMAATSGPVSARVAGPCF